MKRPTLATLALMAAWMSVAGGAPAFAQAAQAPAAPARKFVVPIKGEAEVGYLKPVIKVAGNEVVTTFKIKNLASGAIAGLRVEEFWYDKAGNMIPGDSQRVRQPIQPGDVVTVELHTPKNPGMDRNTYKFSHANGTIKAKVLPKL